ncbi:hypothetical protein Plhal304r1_c031g0100611 [Plasmopara halstedii]
MKTEFISRYCHIATQTDSNTRRIPLDPTDLASCEGLDGRLEKIEAGLIEM